MISWGREVPLNSFIRSEIWRRSIVDCLQTTAKKKLYMCLFNGSCHAWICTSGLCWNGGAHKHTSAEAILAILITGSVTTFLPTSLSTCLKWKIKKRSKKWMKLKKKFFPQISEWCSKQINKKTFFVTKFSLYKWLCVPEGSFVLLLFYVGLLVIFWFSKKIACPYLNASHFGGPPVFLK